MRWSILPVSRRGWWRLGLLLILIVCVINGGALLFARSMTHYRLAQTATVLPLDLVARFRPINASSPHTVGLAFTVHRIELGADEWLEGWYVPHERARAIVALFPGHAASKESLLTQAQTLHRLGYALFLVDFRGVGGSSGQTTTLGVREADDVTATFRYIQQRWPDRPVVLYGYSMGTAAILRAMATTALQPAAIIVEAPFDRLVTTVRHRAERWPVPAAPVADLVVFWGGLQLGVDGFSLNPIDDAATITCPTLMLVGEHDPWITLDEASAVVSRLNGPRELVVFAGARHEILARRDLARWVGSVGPFLERAVAR